MGFGEARSSKLTARAHVNIAQGWKRTDLSPRPRQCSCYAGTISYAARAMGGSPNRKSAPSTHLRCMMIASLRATATHAFLAPMRLASFTPHARSTDHFFEIRKCEFAAS
jgi:hypothetical protein